MNTIKLTMFLNMVENEYAKLNKSNAIGVKVGNQNIYLTNATKDVNKRGTALTFKKYLKEQGITEKNGYTAFRRALNRKTPDLERVYYGHDNNLFVVLDMSSAEHLSDNPELFLIELNSKSDFEIYTTARSVEFNSKGRFVTELLPAGNYNAKSKTQRVVEAVIENRDKLNSIKNIEMEMENESLKQENKKLSDVVVELNSKNADSNATISDLQNVVEATSNEVNDLKYDLAKLRADIENEFFTEELFEAFKAKRK
ncbi:hypothetical protein VoSk93_39940 [Vibrio owensii]